MSVARAVTALEGWISAGDDGGYTPFPGCCRSGGGAFQFELQERNSPGSAWQVVARTAEHAELACDTLYLGHPYDDDYCCQSPIPAPILMPVEPCAVMEPGREYRFVYSAPFRPFEYGHQVPPLTSSGGYPYHVITSGSTCPPAACSGGLTASDFTVALSHLTDGDPLDDDLREWLPEACPIVTPPPVDCDTAGEGRLVSIVVTANCEPGATDAVRLSLDGVSTYPGIAMNYLPLGRLLDEPDVVLDGPDILPFDAAWRAVFTLSVRDHAARAHVVAEVFDRDDPAGPRVPLSLWMPLDEDWNRIADVAWTSADDKNQASEQATTCEGAHCPIRTPTLVTCEDGELIAAGNLSRGDGFTNWEEYRGVICQGVHRRLSPNAADLFMAATPEVVRGFEGADWFARVRTLVTREHRLRLDECHSVPGLPFPRRIKLEGSYCPDPVAGPSLPPSAADQLMAFVDLDPGVMAAFGETNVQSPCPDGAASPRSVLNCRSVDATCRINIPAHQERTPPSVAGPLGQGQPSSPPPQDPLDLPAIQHTVAHEVGHALGMTHYCLNCVNTPTTYCGARLGASVPIQLCDAEDNCSQRPTCTVTMAPGCPESVMVNEFLWAMPCCVTSPCGAGPWWTNLPAGYGAVDLNAIRIW